jgi:predicted nuclease of restriction endonuclease-like (RecB) superfamily
MRIEDEAARRFYEIETVSQQWSVRQLQRQIGSSLYERLALSRDKDRVMELASVGQTVENPRDIFKTPYVLEFTGLEERPEYSETELEQALIDNLQKFLLELGKGFLFEARQKRFSFEEKSFYVDLVFYNRLLQCYVIIDLKVAELKHQDLGQMLMYVNYFDRYVKQEFEKPTVGILLCSQKDDNIVELTLPNDSNIYASAYSLYLPDKALLQRKLAEWIEAFEEEHRGNGE